MTESSTKSSCRLNIQLSPLTSNHGPINGSKLFKDVTFQLETFINNDLETNEIYSFLTTQHQLRAYRAYHQQIPLLEQTYEPLALKTAVEVAGPLDAAVLFVSSPVSTLKTAIWSVERSDIKFFHCLNYWRNTLRFLDLTIFADTIGQILWEFVKQIGFAVPRLETFHLELTSGSRVSIPPVYEMSIS